jgi:hypothetical protein
MTYLFKKITKAYLKSFFLCLVFFAGTIRCTYSQKRDTAVVFHINSAHTAFPDTGRAKGHVYEKVLYTASAHYHDSTVLIVVPPYFNAKRKVDFVFWFHGWGNHIDSAATRYELTRQFVQSNRNAVLVFAETAKNAPDSYGGKLEWNGEFRLLVTDVMAALRSKELITSKCTVGNVLLAGHSGAYRVMAFILQNGQVPVNEVVLFDALYSQTDKFVHWIKKDIKHRFIDLYTDHGGTDEESHNMAKLIGADGLIYKDTAEKDIDPQYLKKNKIIFIHSLREHNDIINQPDNFKLILENSPFLNPVKVKL